MMTINWMEYGLHFLIALIIFLVLIGIGTFLKIKIINSSNRIFNPQEYLPNEEIQTLKQVFYLILMSLLFVDFIYSIAYSANDLFYLALFDIVICLFIVIIKDRRSWKDKLLVFFVLPFGSLTYLLFHISYTSFFDIVHVPLLLYFIRVYYLHFKEYTESNGLGISILLLFIIVFVSTFFTMFVEEKNLIDALVMVSNAFTSNGYAVLGKSIIGKLNSIFLVWGGYIISGAGTASLTAAILLRYFNKRIEKLEQLINDEEME